MAATLDRDAILHALRVVIDPDIRKDIVSLGFVKDVAIAGSRVSFTIELTTPACPVKDQLRDQAATAVRTLPGVSDVDVKMSANVRSASETGRPALAGVKTWALAHLLSNGDLGSILLFGTFLAWGVYARIAAKRRKDVGPLVAPASWTNDAIVVGLGIAVYLALGYAFHPVVIGVPVFGK